MVCSLQAMHASFPAVTRRMLSRGCQRPISNRYSAKIYCSRAPLRRCGCQCAHGCKSHHKVQQALAQPWALLGALAPLVISQPSLANDAAEAAKDVTTAAASAAADLPPPAPTVTFGQSFGSYDPVIGVFFYLVVAALSVLTLGVTYLSIRNWQDSTDEKKERAAFTKTSQDRAMSEMSAKSRSRRQPKASKSGGKGFGS